MSNAKLNKKFLQVAPKATIDSVLNSIAKHYGTTVADIKDELTHEDAESILDYIPESGMRRAVSVLMQKYGIRASYLGDNMNAKSRLQATVVTSAQNMTLGSVFDVIESASNAINKQVARVFSELGLKVANGKPTFVEISKALALVNEIDMAISIVEMNVESNNEDFDAEYMDVKTGGKLTIKVPNTAEAAKLEKLILKKLKPKLVTVTAKGRSLVIAPK